MTNPSSVLAIPKTGIAGLIEHGHSDVMSGFLVFLKEFAKTPDIGYGRLAVFVIAIIGVAAEFFVHVLRAVDWSEVLKLCFKIEETGHNTYHVRVDGVAFFANFLSLKSELANLPERKELVFDLSRAETIDHTVMEFIHHYCEDYERRGGRCEIHGLHLYRASSRHPLAARKRMAPRVSRRPMPRRSGS